MGSGKGKVAAAAGAGAAFRGAALWLQGSRRNVLLSLTAVGVLALGASEAWRHYGTTHAHWESYRLGPGDLHMTPPPSWIHADIKRDVVQIGSLESLSLLERSTVQRVSEACSLHPWVSEVRRVAKHYPASIRVEVDYRKPVAMVEVEHNNRPHLLPIDRLGVVLPPEEFSSAQVMALPRIAVGNTFPAGAVGTAWGDQRVAAAALLAEALCDDWPRLPLFCIEALPTIAGGEPELTAFEIVARDHRRFVWGRAPGREGSGEKTTAQKLERLRTLLESPATATSGTAIDLRT